MTDRMFAIEFFVGPGYGRWARSSERHDTQEAAKASIQRQAIREVLGQVTPVCRRVVPA